MSEQIDTDRLLAPARPIDLAADLTTNLPADHRSGFVAVIGRPNVGKSTLLNRLLGQKIAITSPKPQTTRDQMLGILTSDDAQMLFLDTPGIHRPLHKLGEYMVSVAANTVEDADIVLWLVDINDAPTDEDRAIAELLQALTTRRHRRIKLPPLLIGLNQSDRWHEDDAATAARCQEYLALLDWLTPAPETAVLSAVNGAGVSELLAHLRTRLPVGPRYYPDDQVTDANMRYLAAELIREKALLLLQDEVPHSIAVEVDDFVERSPTLTYIAAVIYVERETQKAIVLGKGGAMIKRIGQSARPEIEEMVGAKVYLELWVKVWERWRRRENMLRQLGYAVAQKGNR